MKKIGLILLTSLFIFTATACGCENKKNNNNVNENNNNTNVEDNQNNQNDQDITIEEQVKNETQEVQEDVIISNIKISEYGASNIVTGVVKNNRNEVRNIELVLKMYNSSTSKLLGRVSTTITEFQPNEERNFEMSIMGDYTTVDKFEVEVKNI